MRKTIYVCDHCNKEFNDMNGYTSVDFSEFIYGKKADLCKECYHELCDTMKNFIHEN